MHAYELTPQDRVLILGGTGFVGKRLIPELARKNIKLRLLGRHSTLALNVDRRKVRFLPATESHLYRASAGKACLDGSA